MGVEFMTIGYKLCKHIAKALQARSQAIRNALERYNAAATMLSPPHSTLCWDEVVQYAFLADFDLLRETCQDIRERAWARPAACVAMDQHFRIIHAEEEILRLNIEIRRVITHLQDEEHSLQTKEDHLQQTDPTLAYQLHRYRLERGHFNELHWQRFQKLAVMLGFTGTLEPGNAVDKALLDGIGGKSNSTHDRPSSGDNSSCSEVQGPQDHPDVDVGQSIEEDDEDDEEEETRTHIDMLTAILN